ncbi:MAG: class I SAM-dependent methyltransferase [Myxococcales bacterium]|nr:class I SAM-dependent methyltransferase [Myxococcales bacterium]
MSSAVEPSTNSVKHQTGNPVVRALIRRFYDRLGERVTALQPQSVVDVGCGEGYGLEYLDGRLPAMVRACDLSGRAVELARARHPGRTIEVADIVDLPYEDDSADLVICLEVLEHLEDPARGLAELARVARRDVLVSVPWEPFFQLGSLLRGNYLRGLGNHPEHLQRWSQAGFRSFIEGTALFGQVTITPAFPWTIAHASLGTR